MAVEWKRIAYHSDLLAFNDAEGDPAAIGAVADGTSAYAARRDHVHAGDAANVTYTPTVATDWDSDADPGDVDNALDQLAERVDDLETGSADMIKSCKQTANVSNDSNVDLVDVTGLAFTLVSGKRYYFKFVMQGYGANTNSGIGFCFSAPAMTFSHFKIKNQAGNAGTDQYYENSQDDDLTAVLVSGSIVATATDYIFIVEGICQPSANGTLQLRFRPELNTIATVIKNGVGFLIDSEGTLWGGGPHKDTHDPNDGSDPLDTAAAAEISAVVAAGTGTSHSLARADHVHAIAHAITDNHILTVDDASAADNDIARFTADGIEGIPYSTLRTDMGIRELLTAARTYYVRTDGHDTASGLNNTTDATTGAFLTGAHGLDIILGDTLDFGGNTVTLKFAAGTYGQTATPADTLLIDRPWVGGGSLRIEGDTTTPSNVILQAHANSFCVYCSATLPGNLYIEGFKTQTGYCGIYHYGLGFIMLGKWDFGAASIHAVADGPAAALQFNEDYTISGNATYHLLASYGGIWVPVVVTLSGTRAFTTYAEVVYGGFLGHDGSFVGSATGKRYHVMGNGVIETDGAGANYFPGDAAGTEDSGGIYL